MAYGPVSYTHLDVYKRQDEERAEKDIKNFIARINYRRRKAGLENAKYIYIPAIDGYARPHFHILISGDGMDRDELEDLWTKCERKNTRRVKPDDDFPVAYTHLMCIRDRKITWRGRI